MTEQVTPTNEENEEPVEAIEVEETTVEVESDEGKTAEAAEVQAAEAEEAAVEVVTDAPESAEPAKEEVPLVRKVAGPPIYVPSESRGRVRRIGNDVRIDQIDYKNISLLSRFLDPRGRIIPRRKTRVSAKVQRRVVKAIKRARHLALLPYTAEHIRITRKHK